MQFKDRLAPKSPRHNLLHMDLSFELNFNFIVLATLVKASSPQ